MLLSLGLKKVRGNDSSQVTSCRATVIQKSGPAHSLGLLESLGEGSQMRKVMVNYYKGRTRS